MAISLKHAFNSGKTDGVDATLVQPSNWNAEHTLQMATGKLLGRTTASTGAAEEIAVSGDLLLSSGTLGINTTVATLTGSQTLTNKTLTSPTIATPTITTSAVVPIVNGGTAASSSLTLQSTSGTGTSDSIALKVGNNGATTAMTANTSGNIEFRAGTAALPAITTTGDTNTGIFFPAADTIAFSEGGAEAMRISSSGRLGVGTTTPESKLAVSNAGAAGLEFFTNYPGGGVGTYIQSYNRSGTAYVSTAYDATDHSFRTSGTERMFLNSSGNALIGTSNTPSNKDTSTPKLVVSGSGVAGAMQVVRHTSPGVGGSILGLTSTRGTDANSYTILQANDGMGALIFAGADGNEFVQAASIIAAVDGTPGDNDMPGRLVFSTTADGGSGTTERLRIASAGQIGIGGANYGTSGQVLTSGGAAAAPSWADTITVTQETFDSGTAATFTQPTSSSIKWFKIEIWGGGGGGADGPNGQGGGGGGGGAYNTITVPFSYLTGATITYTIGAGGAGTTGTSGLAGGTTSVTIAALNGASQSKQWFAYGGNGGWAAAGTAPAPAYGGGGGGGLSKAGINGNATTSYLGNAPVGVGGSDSVEASSANNNTNPALTAYYGGGAGGSGGASYRLIGGNSMFGAGGGGGSDGTVGQVGGYSLYIGGTGGSGAINSANGGAGTVPGGGGGGSETATSGAGAGGRIIFTYW